MKMYRGWLRAIMALREDTGCYHEEYFETVDGERLNLRPQRHTPVNVLIEVYVDEQDCIVHHNTLEVAEDRSSEIIKDIALMRVLPQGAQPTDYIWARTRAAAAELQRVFRQWSRGKWTVNVTPYVIEGYAGQHHVVNANWNWLISQVPRHHNYYHCWGGSLQGICGHAHMNWNRAWTFSNCSEATMIHEQGHNFGVHHSGTPTAEYGEDTWQGSGAGRWGFNTPHQLVMDWIKPDAVYQLASESTARVHLIDGGSDSEARMPGQYCAIQVSKAWDVNFMISSFRNTVRLHRAARPRSFVQTTLLATLNPQFTRVYEGQDDEPYVELVESREGVTEVIVKWSKDISTTPVAKAWPELVWPENTLELSERHSGLYYQPEIGGQGFDCWFEKDRTEIIWMTYLPDGRPRWMIGRGEHNGGDIRAMDLLEPDTQGNLTRVGWMTAFRVSKNRLRIHYFRQDSREPFQGALDLTLLAPKGPGSFLSEFESDDISQVSATVFNGQMYGYVVDRVTERTPLGIRQFTRWKMFEGNDLYNVRNGSFRVASPFDIDFDSRVEVRADELEMDNRKITLRPKFTR